MKLPNIITSARIALSPVFFTVFFIPSWTGTGKIISIIILWVLIILIEVSDLVDGKIARKMNEVSDIGKLLDPFADSLSRLTYFLCFTIAGVMHPLIFLAVMYRDLGVSFIRVVVSRQGVALAARLSGKIKAWVYAVSGFVGLAYFTLEAFLPGDYLSSVLSGVKGVFIVTGLTAIWTLIDYCTPLYKKSRT